MRTTRRQFNRGLAVAAGGALALPVLSSCGGGGDGGLGGKLPGRAFAIGAPSKYLNPGVYREFRDSHQVFLHSDGNFLAALAAVCPHSFCLVNFDELAGLYVCPCHHSKFTEHGLVMKGSVARRSLERCRLYDAIEDGKVTLMVDPTQRYAFETQGDWSRSGSMYELRANEEDGRRRRKLPWQQ